MSFRWLFEGTSTRLKIGRDLIVFNWNFSKTTNKLKIYIISMHTGWLSTKKETNKETNKQTKRERNKQRKTSVASILITQLRLYS